MERQQVHERCERSRHLCQLVRLLERIVLPADQHVLERHPPPQPLQRVDHVGEPILLLDRHQGMAEGRRGSVQRQRQTELLGAPGELLEAREDADRRDRDVSRADAETVHIVQDRERRVYGGPVEQRLAHAHEHDVGRPFRRIEQHELPHLRADLAGGEVAPEPHPAGRAEDAAQRTPHLRRDAQRAPFSLRDEHRFHRFSVGELPEELLGAVTRLLACAERQLEEGERRGQVTARAGGIDETEVIDPVIEARAGLLLHALCQIGGGGHVRERPGRP